MQTRDECKRRLSKLGFKLGVSPHLIATKLLSPDDKNDMLNGLLPEDALFTHVKTWLESGSFNLVDPDNGGLRKFGWRGR